jgi:hypothetical protein
MSNTAKRWPPLIVAVHTPRWVLVRDLALTFAMWLLFAIMLSTEFELFINRQRVRLGLGDFRTDPNWAEFFDRLMPFVEIAMMLVGVLALVSLITLYRRHRSLLLPPPPPLPLAEQATRAGMDPTALAAARNLRVAVVHIQSDGRHRVKPLSESMTKADRTGSGKK